MRGRFGPLVVGGAACFLLAAAGPQPTARGTVPDNPCALISAQDMAAITGLTVTEAKRVPSIQQIVHAQDEGREPDAGAICSYETATEFGAITVSFGPAGPDMSGAYEASRDQYFRTYPGSGVAIPDVGRDAWLSGGTTLTVLTEQRQRFFVATQMFQRQSRAIVIKVARAVLERL